MLAYAAAVVLLELVLLLLSWNSTASHCLLLL
jgi:hypothetical protein